MNIKFISLTLKFIMNIQIREAKKDDMKYVIELITELAVFEKEPSAVVISSDDLINDGFGNNPLFSCFVALVDNKISGMCLGYPRYSTWKGPTMHLEDLIVTQSMRGKGIGFALFSHFIKFSHLKNVRRIEWAVLDWNVEAINFYKKNGAYVSKEWQIAQMNELAINNFISKNEDI